MIAKPTYKPHKPPKDIPAKLRQEVNERDNHICRKCEGRGKHIHHIAYGTMGRRRVHTIENLITLCDKCHEWAQETQIGRVWCMTWSHNRYGNVVDLIKQYGHGWKEYANQSQ